MNPRSKTPLRCRFGRRVLAVLSSALALSLASSGLRAAEAVEKAYDIPAGVAEQTLKTFSAQSGLEVLFATRTVGRTVTNPVTGTLTAREAIGRLLRGTGLAASQDERTGAFTVASDPNAARAAPAAASARPESDDFVELEQFVVEGERAGQALAIRQKREAANIMDAVSADAVGKFPDGNAAEALRRVPGVTLEIDQSEGRFVVVRGIDAALNNVTLNGQNIGSPAEQGRRGLSMDSVPAELIARLEVVKAVTPDRDHNAIGGSVNIVTTSAFDRPEGFLFGSLSGAYTDFTGKWGWWGAGVNYGRVFGPDRDWGVIAGVSYSRRKYGSQTSDALDWTPTGGGLVPLTQESFDYAIDRARFGVNLALEHRPREGHELYLRFNFNEFIDVEGRQKTGFEFNRGVLSNQTATIGAFSQGRATKEFRDYKQKHLIDAWSIGGSHLLADAWTAEWQVGYSSGERDTPRRVDWEYRSGGGTFPNSYDLAGRIPIITPNATFYSPASFPFRRVRFRTDDEREEITSAQLDLRRDATFGGRDGSWKIGAKWVESDKTQDRQNTNFNLASGAANLFTLAQPGLAGSGPSGFMEGRYRLGPTIDLAANQRFLRDNPGRFTFDAASSLANSTEADFDATEEVLAGYAMATVELGGRSTLLGGVRVERTDATYSGNERRNGVYTRLTLGGSYTQFLPGLHYTFRANDRLVLRAAWTNTFGRTNYTDLAPRNILDDVDLGGGVFQGSLSSGNPDLDPFESMNFDGSAEYYLAGGGIVSVGLFHKRIDNPVYSRAFTLTNTTYDGRNYSTLAVSRPENAPRGDITGLELNWQQFFSGLPAPFDGLGVNVNYTITDSSAEIFGRAADVPFFKQADAVGNFALIYERGGFEARLPLERLRDLFVEHQRGDQLAPVSFPSRSAFGIAPVRADRQRAGMKPSLVAGGLFFVSVLGSAAAGAPPGPGGWRFEELRRFAAPEARQGVAADADFLFVISNHELGKYPKDGGPRVTAWGCPEGEPLVHLNAGVVYSDLLYAAHSNYPGVPHVGSVEIWEPATLRHVGSMSLGRTDGSLTWFDRREGRWLACFVHYAGRGGEPGRDPRWSRLVEHDDEWRPTGRGWVFPPALIAHLGTRGYGMSGGAIGPGGLLFVTGHDETELCVLEFPAAASTLRWVATIPMTAEGQAFAWDPVEPGVIHLILKRTREVITGRVTRGVP